MTPTEFGNTIAWIWFGMVLSSIIIVGIMEIRDTIKHWGKDPHVGS